MSSLDWRVFLFTALIGAGATLGFGAAPAFAATRADLAEAVKGQRSGRARDSRLRSTFLIAQVAMSVLLLVVAGLFIRSAKNATSIDPGFDRHQRGRRLARSGDARLFGGEGTGVSPHPARSPQWGRRTRRRHAGGHRPGDALEPDHRSAARIRPGAGPRRTIAATAGLLEQRGTGPLPHAADRAARRPGFHACGHGHRASCRDRQRDLRQAVLAGRVRRRPPAPATRRDRPRPGHRGRRRRPRQQVRDGRRGSSPVRLSAALRSRTPHASPSSPVRTPRRPKPSP